MLKTCRWWILGSLCLIALACGHSSGPLMPDSSMAPSDESTLRSAEGLLGRVVTLNGARTTNPAWRDAPFQVSTNAKSGDVALVNLRCDPVPTRPNTPMAQLSGTAGNYGFRWIPAGTNSMMSALVDHDGPVTLTLWNGLSPDGPLFDQAVKWRFTATVRPSRDRAEPDDDGNIASLSDRGRGTIISLGSTSTRTLFQRADGLSRDQEDWFQFQGLAGHSVQVALSNSNARWGVWRYRLRLLDPLGKVISAWSESAAESMTVEQFTPVSGTYYLQVSGTPITRPDVSVFFSEYDVRIGDPPRITAVTPSSGMSGSTVTFTPVNHGAPIISASWNFGGGATPNTSTDVKPVERLGGIGPYQGTLVASSATGRTSFPFSFQVTPHDGVKLVGLAVHVLKYDDATWPTLLPGLAAWDEASMRDWVVTHINPIYTDTGVQFDPDRITFDPVVDPAHFNVDDFTEWSYIDNYCTTFDPSSMNIVLFNHNYTDGTYGKMNEASQNTTCDNDNLERGCWMWTDRPPDTWNGDGWADYVFAHELGHVFYMSHICVGSCGDGGTLEDLMSYNTDGSTLLYNNVTRYAATGCMLTQDVVQNQLQIVQDWAWQYM